MANLGFAQVTKENGNHPPNYTTGMGPSVARSGLAWFSSKTGQALLERMAKLGIDPQGTEPGEGGDTGGVFAGKTFVITGTLPTMSSEEAKAMIEANGSKTTGSVSKKTDYLLAGEKASSIQVRVTEDEPKALTITVRNKPNGSCNNITRPTRLWTSPQVPEPHPNEPPRKPRRKRDSNQYRDTGQWRDPVVQECEAAASGESLGGMSLWEFKAATESVVAERANLKRIRGDSGAIAHRNTADQEAKKIINRVIAGVKA